MLAGRTPIPCVALQSWGVKFTDLFALARELGADCLATGHYVRRVDGRGRRRAAPRRRSGARPELFPVRDDARRSSISCAFRWAACPRRAVREIAARARARRRGQARQPGHLLRARRRLCRRWSRSCGPRPSARRRDRRSATAACSGEHRGLIHFTVGQRRGLEIGGQAGAALRRPARAGDAQRRRRPAPRARGRGGAADRDQLARRGAARGAHRQGALAGQAGAGAVRRRDCAFDTPEYGVAPGQAAVLYAGDRVLGGGWIEETVAAELEPA